MTTTRRRTKRTLHIDDDKLARAGEIAGTDSVTKIVDEALRRMVARKAPRALFASGDPEWAHRVDEELAEGFGTQ